MAGLYPVVGDNDISLLKKIAYNTGLVADGAGIGVVGGSVESTSLPVDGQLSAGHRYTGTITGNRSLTIPAGLEDGEAVSVVAEVTADATVTIPSCVRVGQESTPVTSIDLPNGTSQVFTIVNYNGTTYLLDSVDSAANPAIADVTGLQTALDSKADAAATTSALSGKVATTATIAVDHGGTGAVTAAAARVALNVAPVAIAASEIDWNLGKDFTKTLGANTTFTFANDTSGMTISVAITNTASNYTVTWPTVVWAGSATAPVQTVGAKTDIYTFKKLGTTIYGSVLQNF